MPSKYVTLTPTAKAMLEDISITLGIDQKRLTSLLIVGAFIVGSEQLTSDLERLKFCHDVMTLERDRNFNNYPGDFTTDYDNYIQTIGEYKHVKRQPT